MGVGCVGCREDVALPFEFKMAFQPIVDLRTQLVWGYEALVRGPNGEPALSVLSQVSDETRYRFDQAARVTAIETAGALFKGQDLKLSINFCRMRSMSRRRAFRSRLRPRSAFSFPAPI
jgi:EAL domain-containing protein (putative c-di-GMP-specific phosphodiesterase class I)